MAFVTLCSYRDPIDAHVQRAMLDAAGIPAVVADDHVIAVQWLYSTAVGGAKLQVLAEDVEAAREILGREEPSNLSEPSQSSSAWADGDLCPACGSARVGQHPLLRRSLALSLLVELPLFLWRRRWVCEACGHSWRRSAARATALPSETCDAEEAVRGEPSSYPLMAALLALLLAVAVVYLVLRLPAPV